MKVWSRFATMFLVLSLVSPGCVPKGDEAGGGTDFNGILPNGDVLAITIPDNAGTGGLAVGDSPIFYEVTRGVSAGVNGHVGLMLLTLHLVALAPASDRGDDYKIIGPTEPKNLEKNSWTMEIRKVAEQEYTFSLEGRAKGDTGAFLPVVTGTVTPSGAAGKSSGTMTLAMDNWGTLDMDGCLDPAKLPSGLINVQWDNTTDTRTVDVDWDNFVDCKGKTLTAASYHFEQGPELGIFEFESIENIHAFDATKAADETVLMKSRWGVSGAGRSDVIISGDEIAADLAAAGMSQTQVQASQCWGELFGLSYTTTDPIELMPLIFGEQAEVGNAADCAYADAEYPAL